MRILVTGASGYIGAQTCKALSQYHEIVAVDRNTVKHNYFKEFYCEDYGSFEVQQLLLNIDAVVHIGATSLVGPSVLDPSKYYKNNVVSTIALLDACKAQGVKRVVFASSAATYGEPKEDVCTESGQHEPVNPYGWSKRMTEIMLADYATAYGINSVSCRFFNVAGADLEGEFGQEKQATHIIAKIMELALDNKEFTLNGDGFDTPDGTCLRDYTHINDIARGFLLALHQMFDNGINNTYNLGNSTPVSVLELIKAVETELGEDINTNLVAPRSGDMVKTYADVTFAKDNLGWEPTKTINDIIVDELAWQKPKLKRKHNL
jgi:UDP-glucose 4-epimerase